MIVSTFKLAFVWFHRHFFHLLPSRRTKNNTRNRQNASWRLTSEDAGWSGKMRPSRRKENINVKLSSSFVVENQHKKEIESVKRTIKDIRGNSMSFFWKLRWLIFWSFVWVLLTFSSLFSQHFLHCRSFFPLSSLALVLMSLHSPSQHDGSEAVKGWKRKEV